MMPKNTTGTSTWQDQRMLDYMSLQRRAMLGAQTLATASCIQPDYERWSHISPLPALLSCMVVTRVLHAGSLSCNSPPRAVPASRRRPTTPAGCASAAGSSCAAQQRTGAAATACAAAAGWTPQLVQPPTGPRRAAGHSACCARCAPSGGICRSRVQLLVGRLDAVLATADGAF